MRSSRNGITGSTGSWGTRGSKGRKKVGEVHAEGWLCSRGSRAYRGSRG